MDASIKGENIKIFQRLLQCASKYGDDLNIHASSKAWEIAVTNSSKSAFCLFKLHKEFFDRWSAKSRKGIKCKLLVKSVLAVLGKTAQINTINRIDLRIIDPSNELRPLQHRKNGERDGTTKSSSSAPTSNNYDDNGDSDRHFGDEDEFTDDEDTRISIESKLIVRLVCKHGVTKKHSLHLGSSDFLRADVDPDTTPSGFVIATRTLRDWLENFALSNGSGYPGNPNSGGTDHLGWMFTKKEVRVKSWEGMSGGGLCTEIKVDSDEFQDYEVAEDRIDLILPMKEFRATLMLGEQIGAALNLSFSEASQPLTLTSLDQDVEHFSVFCAIATTACEAFNDIRSPSTEIKRSDSDRPPAPPTNRPSARLSSLSSSANARNDSQTSTSSNSRKRKGSETPSQSRKRSSLNFAAAQEPMGNVYLAPANGSNSSNTNGESSNANPRNQRRDDEMDFDHPDHISPSQRGDTGDDQEALFLPGASQRPFSPDQEENDHQNQQSPQKSQAIRMSQAEILEYAGLDDLDLEEALDSADLDDEREMEEEFTRSQAAQDQSSGGHQQGQSNEVAEKRGGPSLSRQISRNNLGGTGSGSGSGSKSQIRRNSSSPEKGKNREMPNNPSPTKRSNETSNSGNKSSNKSHPAWVTDSISENTTSTSDNSGSGLIWDSEIDNPTPAPSKRQHSPLKTQNQLRGYNSSPQKRSSNQIQSPGKRHAVSLSGMRTQSPTKGGGKSRAVNQDDDEEFDELTDDDEAGHPTQNRQGSTKFKSLFDD